MKHFPLHKPHYNMSASKRLMHELKQLQNDTSDDVILRCTSDSGLFEWRSSIRGPPDTPYADVYFNLLISVPTSYPLQPPAVTFATRIFHPNVHFKTGEICLDLLKGQWSAVYTLQSVCRAIVSLLAHPEADSPLNCDCGNLLRSGDIRGYNSMARMYSKLYGSPTPSTEEDEEEN